MASPGGEVFVSSVTFRNFYPTKVKAMKGQENLSRHDAAGTAI
jgi:hypothetical protein